MMDTDIDDYWKRPIVDRLRDRASAAEREETWTAKEDAAHFREAADAIERLDNLLRGAILSLAQIRSDVDKIITATSAHIRKTP